MRALILALAALAGAKIWVQESAYRAAAQDAIVLAYRVRAADACAAASGPTPLGANTGMDWSSGAEPRVTVGNPRLPVHIWQFEHELWNARFRQPYLVLSAPGAALSCSYDILAGTAAIARS